MDPVKGAVYTDKKVNIYIRLYRARKLCNATPQWTSSQYG